MLAIAKSGRFAVILAGGLLLCTTQSAYAGLVGVKEIKVFNAIPTWLQVSEVVATETGTGVDAALSSNGAVAAAGGPDFTNWPGSMPSFAIDGIGPAAFPNMYHPGASSGAGEHLIVTLAAPTELDSITIFGRTDCCSTRDIYNVQLLDMSGSLLHTVMNLDATGSSHFATAQLPDTSNNRVPEPATLALFGLGLASFGFIRRRKFSA